MGNHYALRTQTLEERRSMFLTGERVVAMLSTFFGGLALLLASVGLYGLMSYTVTRRTSEIVVRMALAASRLISGMLFGVSPADPAPIACSIVILLGVAILAGYLPAPALHALTP